MKSHIPNLKSENTTDLELGTLYDVNKTAMAQEPVMTTEILEQKKLDLAEYFEFDSHSVKYYMLLCNERRDYTVFNLSTKDTEKCAVAAQDVIECMTNRGLPLGIDQQPDGAWELWIKTEEGCFAYFLFPYDNAVLEY